MNAVANEYLAIFTGHNKGGYLYQRILKKTSKVELVSAPCKISYGCSQAIRFKEEEMAIVLKEAKKSNIIPKGVYKIIPKGRLENYEKVQWEIKNY